MTGSLYNLQDYAPVRKAGGYIYRTNQTYTRLVHIHLLLYIDTDWIKSILTEIDYLYGVNSLPPTISIWAAYCHCVLYSVLYNLQDYAPGLKAGGYI